MKGGRVDRVEDRTRERPHGAKKRRPMGMSIGVMLVSLTILLCFADPARAALIDNGDGTITDDDLGIMWLQESNDNPMTWSSAKTWADNLVFADYDDWRLPSAASFVTGLPDTLWLSVNNEWGHLYGVEWGNPASPADIAPMIGYQCSWYWTGTENPNNPSEAYAFLVSYNDVWLVHSFSKSEMLCDTAVRGPVASLDLLIPPVACFTESAHSVVAGETIQFDPRCSFDVNGTIDLYEWDFDGDGVVDYSSTTPEVVSHTYTEAGTYSVTLRVTDNDGLTDTVSASKFVRPLIPPVPCFSETDHKVNVGETIEFYPGCSNDSDGSIVLYEWDFDGDGVIDYNSTTPEVVSHTYTEEGIYAVTLRVTDNDGLTDTTLAIKEVREPITVILEPIIWILLVLIAIILVTLIPVSYSVWKMRKAMGLQETSEEEFEEE